MNEHHRANFTLYWADLFTTLVVVGVMGSLIAVGGVYASHRHHNKALVASKGAAVPLIFHEDCLVEENGLYVQSTTNSATVKVGLTGHEVQPPGQITFHILVSGNTNSGNNNNIPGIVLCK